MAVCQTALALPRVGMESIYTPALVFAEKKREGRKERKCITFMKSLRILYMSQLHDCPPQQCRIFPTHVLMDVFYWTQFGLPGSHTLSPTANSSLATGGGS